MQDVRQLFLQPQVIAPAELPVLTWKTPDEEGLVQWLCHEKQFSEERVRGAVAKMVASKGKANQNRLESFFKVRAPTHTWCHLTSGISRKALWHTNASGAYVTCI
jgi:hypothetical protein